MADFAELGKEFGAYILKLTTEMMLGNPGSLSEMERDLRIKLQKMGQFLLGSWIMLQAKDDPNEHRKCPHCDGKAKYQYKREATLLTVVGQIKYQRAYYVCPDCRKGHYPLDIALGLRPGEISAELESLSGMTGAQLAFGQGSELFEALTLVSLSDHSMAKATQAIGAEVKEQEIEWKAQSQDIDWLQTQKREAEHPKRLYGAIDAAKVHIRGEDGAVWRDMKVGAWFTTHMEPPTSPHEDWEIRATDISYYCDIQPAEQFGDLIWATGCQHQAQLAEELVFLGDGAEWIWNQVQTHYPKATQIVDWFHAAQYIPPIAKAAFTDETQQQNWIRKVRTYLWEGQLDAVIAACEHFSDHLQAGHDALTAITYFQNNRQRMDYATYRAKGYQIGSGTIESGCKRIVTQRLKVPGAIWNLDGAVKTAKARAALLSGRWSDITARRAHLPLAA